MVEKRSFQRCTCQATDLTTDVCEKLSYLLSLDFFEFIISYSAVDFLRDCVLSSLRGVWGPTLLVLHIGESFALCSVYCAIHRVRGNYIIFHEGATRGDLEAKEHILFYRISLAYIGQKMIVNHVSFTSAADTK
jgi:hypothetical protein